jgi:hypothetical protein
VQGSDDAESALRRRLGGGRDPCWTILPDCQAIALGALVVEHCRDLMDIRFVALCPAVWNHIALYQRGVELGRAHCQARHRHHSTAATTQFIALHGTKSQETIPPSLEGLTTVLALYWHWH